jgi:hypothetical protein
MRCQEQLWGCTSLREKQKRRFCANATIITYYTWGSVRHHILATVRFNSDSMSLMFWSTVAWGVNLFYFFSGNQASPHVASSSIVWEFPPVCVISTRNGRRLACIHPITTGKRSWLRVEMSSIWLLLHWFDELLQYCSITHSLLYLFNAFFWRSRLVRCLGHKSIIAPLLSSVDVVKGD